MRKQVTKGKWLVASLAAVLLAPSTSEAAMGLHKFTPVSEGLQNKGAEDPLTFSLLTYNTSFGNSPHEDDEDQRREILIYDKIIASQSSYDILVFNDVMFSEEATPMQCDLRDWWWPYFTRIVDTSDNDQDGGTWIQSRWEITTTESGVTATQSCGSTDDGFGHDIVFDDVNSSYCANDDCWANKGVMLGRVKIPIPGTNPTQYRYARVLGTHMNADYDSAGQYSSVRQNQLSVIEQLAGTTSEEYTILAGDLNFGLSYATFPENTTFDNNLWVRGSRLGSFPKSYTCNSNNFHDDGCTGYSPTPDDNLDYVAYKSSGLLPRNLRNYAMQWRGNWGSYTNKDLSEHHPVRAVVNEDIGESKQLIQLTNTSSSDTTATVSTSNPASFWAYEYMEVLTGDFDGDYKTDILKWDRSASNTGESLGAWVMLGRNMGTWTNWTSAGNATVNRYSKLLVGDVNNDGNSDLIINQINSTCSLTSPATEPGCDSNLAVALANPSCPATGTSLTNCNFGAFIGWTTPAPWNTNTNTRILLGDFNNDNKTDVAKIAVANGVASSGYDIKVGLSTFTSTTTAPYYGSGSFTTTVWGSSWWNGNYAEYQAGDFTGDGKTDIARIDRPSTPGTFAATPIYIFAANAAGTNFTWDGTSWANPNLSTHEYSKILLGKINTSDAYTDLLIVDTRDFTHSTFRPVTALKSTGTSFVSDVIDDAGNNNLLQTSRCDKFFLGNFNSFNVGGGLELLHMPQSCRGENRNVLTAVPNMARVSFSNMDCTPASTCNWQLYHFDPQSVTKSAGSDMFARRWDKVLSGDFNDDNKWDLMIFPVP